MLVVRVATVFLYLGASHAANILMMTLGGTKSHKGPFLSLGKGLVSKGHRVTLVSAFPPGARSPVEEVAPLDVVLFVKNFTDWDLLGPRLQGNNPISIFQIFTYSSGVCQVFYSSKETKRLLSRKVDLLILDGGFPECLLGFVHHFGVPFVYLNTVAYYTHQLSLAGNPTMYSVTPFLDHPHSDRMTFFERTKNAAFHVMVRMILTLVNKVYLEPILRQNFGNAIPPVDTMGKNVSLILQNGHHTMTHPRPYLPGVVEVACLQCRAPESLPKDLEEFVSGGSQKGFIYVSFGTGVKTENMPKKMRRMMLEVFKKLPYQVVWQFDGKPGPDLLENVKISKWLPQQDLLGHAKIVAFVNHGGLNSIFEAAYHGVPMVTLPVFCDQVANSYKSFQDGYSYRLDLKDLTVDIFSSAINKVIIDKRYKENAVHRSILFRDQPELPLDRAVYWVEYVLRHRGAYHLQGAAKDLNFSQYFMLDTLVVLALFLYVFLKIFKWFWQLCFLRKRVTKTKVKTK